MRWLGRFSNTQTLRFLWNTSQASGASVTRSTDGSIRVYKNDGAGQRSTSAGITDTEDFDGITGVHLCEVDLSDNTDPNFYSLGQFQVELVTSVIGGASVNVPIAHFEITHATGGGEIGSPANPPAGNLPADQPQVFMIVEDRLTGEILYAWAESYGGPFSDNSDYFGGYKEARLLAAQLSPRQYTTVSGGIQLTSWKVTLDDTDRYLRALFGVASLHNHKATLYVIDHPNRLAELEPYRIISGVIVNDGAEDNFTYSIEVEGTLGRHSAAALTEKLVPPHMLFPSELPALIDRWNDGWAPPIGYGQLSDEDSATPQGVVPGVYLGDLNLQDTLGGGAADADAIAIGFFGHAIQDTLNIYYNDPATPDVRSVVPFSEYGVNIVVPHKPGWVEATGQAGQYLDYGGYRYTVAFINAGIDPALAQAVRDGRILISGNFNGIEALGDGTGNLIEAPARIFQHFWTNFVDGDYATGNWPDAIPFFGDYGVINFDRVEEASEYSDSINVFGSILIGREGRQQTVFEVITEMAQSWDLEIGENHHGQIVTDHEDPTSVATIQLSDQHDAIAFRTRRDRKLFATGVMARFGYRYLPPTSPRAAPAEGEPLPADPVAPFAQWSGTTDVLSVAALAANNGQSVPLVIDLYGVRDATTAAVIAGRVLSRAVGPENSGPVTAELTTGWQGIGYNVSGEDEEIDLHTTVGITHAEGLGSPGFVEEAVRIRSVTVDPLRGLVTLEGRLLG